MLLDKTAEPFNPPIDIDKFDGINLTLPALPKSFLDIHFDSEVSL